MMYLDRCPFPLIFLYCLYNIPFFRSPGGGAGWGGAGTEKLLLLLLLLFTKDSFISL